MLILEFVNQLNGNGKHPGRPSTKSDQVITAICNRLATGESLRSICREDSMPCFDTVFAWLKEDNKFSEQYARAREIQADYLADEALDESREATPENAHAVRVLVDAIKWHASKTAPKKYGDKGTEINVTAQMVVMDASRMKALQERSLQAEKEVLRIETPRALEPPNEETCVNPSFS